MKYNINLILPPNILHPSLRQPLIRPILLLPLHEATLKHKHLLLLTLLLAEDTLALPGIPQRGRRSTLLAQRAVENNFLFVRQGADEFGEAVV